MKIRVPASLMTSIASAALIAAAGAATAADIPVKAPVLKAPVWRAYDWSGFYIGVNAGYSTGTWNSTGFLPGATFAAPGAGTASPNVKGFVVGGQLGYNWQYGNWVLGLEGDFQITTEKATLDWVIPGGGVLVAVIPATPISNEWKFPWFGTGRGRIGYAMDNWLFYGTAGAAYGNVKSSLTTPATTISSSKSKLGWTAGAGAEWAFDRNWSAKFEYLYVNLGSVTFFDATATPVTSKINDHIFRIGLNYRFGGPIAVRF